MAVDIPAAQAGAEDVAEPETLAESLKGDHLLALLESPVGCRYVKLYVLLTACSCYNIKHASWGSPYFSDISAILTPSNHGITRSAACSCEILAWYLIKCMHCMKHCTCVVECPRVQD